MMNYSNKPSMCRVDFFKPSGKHYKTEAVDFDGFWHDNLNGFERALYKHLRAETGKLRLPDMVAVCLDPYVEHPVPRMIEVSRIEEILKSANNCRTQGISPWT